MPLMAAVMELLSCALPAAVDVVCSRALARFCTVAKMLWSVLGATANESPAVGAPDNVTCMPAKVMACPLVYVPEVTTVPPEFTTW